MGRLVLAIIAGVLVGGIVIYVAELPGQMLYPPPAGMDMRDADAMGAYVSGLPAGAFAIVLLAWVLGSLAGSWVATRVAARNAIWPGLLVAAVQLAAVGWNVMRIPHPVWMVVAALIAIPAAAYLGARLALRSNASAPA